MRLRSLLGRADLGLVLLTGEHAIDRPITSVYTTDLPDPSRFLTGGELVLTGLVWWHQDGDADPFVAALAAAGVCALGAGTIAHSGIPADLVRACAARGVALIEVPEHVSFGAVTEVVVLDVAAGAPDIADAMDHAAALLGAPCWLLSPTGRVVAGSDPPPPLPRRQLLVRQFLTARSLPRSARSGSTVHSVLAVGPREPAGWFVAVESDHASWSANQQAAVDILARTCAAKRSEVDSQRAAAHTTAPLASGTVCVLACAGPLGLLDELVAHLGSGTVHVTDADPVAVIQMPPLAREPLLAELREVGQVLGPGLADVADGHLALGVSDCLDDLPAALAEAADALRLARHRTGPVRIQDAAEPAGAKHLVAALPAELISSYVDRVLGPVLDYDRRHVAGLLHTLQVFMACSCSWSRAAAQLHVHVNTLRYRIGRIEDLTGRDLSTLTDQADVHLALQFL